MINIFYKLRLDDGRNVAIRWMQQGNKNDVLPRTCKMLLIQSDNTSAATETDIDLLLVEAFRNHEIAEYLERVTDIDQMLIDAFDGVFDEWYMN